MNTPPEDSSCCSRTERYTLEELQFLLNTVQKFPNIIESPNCHSETKSRKSLVWQYIADELTINFPNGTTKTALQLRNWWKRTKSRAKQRMALGRESDAFSESGETTKETSSSSRGYLEKIFTDICEIKQKMCAEYSAENEYLEYRHFLKTSKINPSVTLDRISLETKESPEEPENLTSKNVYSDDIDHLNNDNFSHLIPKSANQPTETLPLITPLLSDSSNIDEQNLSMASYQPFNFELTKAALSILSQNSSQLFASFPGLMNQINESCVLSSMTSSNSEVSSSMTAQQTPLTPTNMRVSQKCHSPNDPIISLASSPVPNRLFTTPFMTMSKVDLLRKRRLSQIVLSDYHGLRSQMNSLQESGTEFSNGSAESEESFPYHEKKAEDTFATMELELVRLTHEILKMKRRKIEMEIKMVEKQLEDTSTETNTFKERKLSATAHTNTALQSQQFRL